MADRRLLPGEFGYELQGGPTPAPDQQRSWLRAGLDTALDVGSIVPETLRTVAGIGRTIEDQPQGWWARREQEASKLENWYKGLYSERGQRLQEKRLFPSVDEESAWSDLPAVAARNIAGIVPFLLGGWAL